MKTNLKSIIVVGILLIVISFISGYMFNSDKYDIVDKQDELTVIYDAEQDKFNNITKTITNLTTKYETMKEMETATDEEVALMEAIPTTINVLNQSGFKSQVLLNNLKFAYAVLQEMR